MRIQDQTGYELEVGKVGKIISIVPSQTEFLVDLGLKSLLVGVTKFCVHPNGLIHEVGHVGGTKNLNIERIRSLKPDLIIGNKEENTKNQIEELRKEFPVYLSDINTVEESFKMMRDLGEILQVSKKVEKLINQIEKERSKFKKISYPKRSCLYFIWKNPDMVVGSSTFIDSMIQEAGFENLGRKMGERYPEVTELKEIPDYIFLSTEPYPFKEEDMRLFKKKYPNSKVKLVDGEMFSWYGSRMRLAYPYFESLL